MKPKTFIIHYPFEGRTQGIEVKAKDFEEARRKLNAIQYGEVSGEVKCTLRGPALVFMPVAMLWCSFMNLLKRQA